jgi:uncharacterized protein YbjT (DUF2867 family)
MKAFLTGGSGFVGKRMLTMLLEREYTVNALARSDRATLKSWRNQMMRNSFASIIRDQLQPMGVQLLCC